MKNNISTLRDNLFETMQLLKDGKIDVHQAKAVAELGQVIINSAKVENDFISKQGGRGTGFIPAVEHEGTGKIERPKAEYSNKGYKHLLDQHAPA